MPVFGRWDITSYDGMSNRIIYCERVIICGKWIDCGERRKRRTEILTLCRLQQKEEEEEVVVIDEEALYL